MDDLVNGLVLTTEKKLEYTERQLKSLIKMSLTIIMLLKYWLYLNFLLQSSHNLIVLTIWSFMNTLLERTMLINTNAFNGHQQYWCEYENKNNEYRNMSKNILRKSICSTNSFAFFYFYLANSCYFAQGNSNSLNTIQISSGLVGLNSVDDLSSKITVAILMLCVTYASNVFWFLSRVNHIILTELNSLQQQEILNKMANR
jgi:hypothetical protein